MPLPIGTTFTLAMPAFSSARADQPAGIVPPPSTAWSARSWFARCPDSWAASGVAPVPSSKAESRSNLGADGARMSDYLGVEETGCGVRRGRVTYGPAEPPHRRRTMLLYWLGVLLATIGATLILSALAFVSTLVGVLINAMIVLVGGPFIEPMLARRRGPAR